MSFLASMLLCGLLLPSIVLGTNRKHPDQDRGNVSVREKMAKLVFFPVPNPNKCKQDASSEKTAKIEDDSQVPSPTHSPAMLSVSCPQNPTNIIGTIEDHPEVPKVCLEHTEISPKTGRKRAEPRRQRARRADGAPGDPRQHRQHHVGQTNQETKQENNCPRRHPCSPKNNAGPDGGHVGYVDAHSGLSSRGVVVLPRFCSNFPRTRFASSRGPP